MTSIDIRKLAMPTILKRRSVLEEKEKTIKRTRKDEIKMLLCRLVRSASIKSIRFLLGPLLPLQF